MGTARPPRHSRDVPGGRLVRKGAAPGGRADNVLDPSRVKPLLAAYPGLGELAPDVAVRLQSECASFRAADRDVLLEEEDFCTAYPLIVAGSARVVKCGVSGREIVLYHVRAGEYCLLSAVGLLAGTRHPARAIAEGKTSGVVVPADLFRDLMRSPGRFSAEVFSAVARRIDVLVGLIEQISILHVDQRLAVLLLSRGHEIRATHQDLADEIGCARENVSRALGHFRRHGFVRLGRGRVTVLQTGPLTSIAAAERPFDAP